MSAPAVLELRNVGRVFGSKGNQTAALKSVSLTVKQGEFVAIVGPSGSGKSTLLNVLGLLDRPTSGIFLLNGTDASSLTERQRDRIRNEQIGFVFQDSHMLLDDTSAGNASLPLKIRGTPLRERRLRVVPALVQLGLGHRIQELAVNLSGGERQRVAIARAISTQPTLLLADEPTGSLDSENSQRIIEHLTELNNDGVTVVVITHDSTVAAAATRRIRLVDGVVYGGSEIGVAPTGVAVGNEPLVQVASQRDIARGNRPSLIGRLFDETLDALSSHSSRPGRAMLLLLAFVLGTGGLVCSVGISQSAAAQVADRLTAASLDEVVVRASDPEAYAAGFYFPAPRSPSAAIQNLHGVRGTGFIASVPQSEARVSMLPPDSPTSRSAYSGSIFVADSGYLGVQGVRTSPAQAGQLLDNRWSGRVAILGEDAAASLGISSSGPGSKIWVDRMDVDVVGFIDDAGRDSSLRNAVVLSVAAAHGLRPEDPSIVVRTTPGFPAAVADAIPPAVSPDAPSSVKIETVADLRNLRVGVATDLGVLVAVVSVLLLVLACLSSAVAMYLSVQSRASEIALRRAIGASRASIWRIFTMEGLVIGAAGGLAGGALGLCSVVVVCVGQGWTPTLHIGTLALGLAAGSLSGVLSATYPAVVAARADPALAIRS